MKWHVWVTGYPSNVVEIEEGMPMSAITAMAHAARLFKAHHNGEIVEMNAYAATMGIMAEPIHRRFVRIDHNGTLKLA